MSPYAVDVVLFYRPTSDDTAAVHEIPHLFSKASGLRVNYSKSSAALINCTKAEAAIVTAGLGCPIVEMPLIYLGIPLTIRRPTCAQLQPLVDHVAAKLPTWKAHLMDKAGRLKLIKSVLSAIPTHQLLVYAPPKKILKLIEKIQRGFLWAGRKEANGSSCHVSWNRVCRPIEHVGLGIQNMNQPGLALCMRWLWFSRTDASQAWQGLNLQLSPGERALFFASTYMSLGDGRTALFSHGSIDGSTVARSASLRRACTPASPSVGVAPGSSSTASWLTAGPATYAAPWALTKSASTCCSGVGSNTYS
jgi:hypothetical protein